MGQSFAHEVESKDDREHSQEEHGHASWPHHSQERIRQSVSQIVEKKYPTDEIGKVKGDDVTWLRVINSNGNSINIYTIAP